MTMPIDGFCHAKRGLLHLRECGKHALSSCATCGTGLCEDHQILTAYGVFCPECAAGDERFAGLEDERLERARYRRESETYYESAYYYGFTDTDFRAFDAEAGEGGKPTETEETPASEAENDDASDSDDPDNFMES